MQHAANRNMSKLGFIVIYLYIYIDAVNVMPMTLMKVVNRPTLRRPTTYVIHIRHHAAPTTSVVGSNGFRVYYFIVWVSGQALRSTDNRQAMIRTSADGKSPHREQYHANRHCQNDMNFVTFN